MSSSDYISDGYKDLSHMNTEEFYISEAFMDKMTVHIAKNFMDLPRIKVPLILGVWGGKGQGKSSGRGANRGRQGQHEEWPAFPRREARDGSKSESDVGICP